MEYLALQSKEKLFHINSETETAGALSIEDTRWLAASRALNGCAFKLYIYLASQKDGAPCVLSAQEICFRIGISPASFPKAIDELQSAGFLVAAAENRFHFNIAPQSEQTWRARDKEGKHV